MFLTDLDNDAVLCCKSVQRSLFCPYLRVPRPFHIDSEGKRSYACAAYSLFGDFAFDTVDDLLHLLPFCFGSRLGLEFDIVVDRKLETELLAKRKKGVPVQDMCGKAGIG